MSDRLARPTPPPEFRSRLRAELMRAAPAALAPAPRRGIAWWRPIATAAVVALLVVAANSAAAQSLPGDPPFAIKRTVEEAQLLLSVSEAVRVEVRAAHAEHRLAELQRATEQQRPAAETQASVELADALERLAGDVEMLRRNRPDVAARSEPASGDARAVAAAERVAATQVSAISVLLPAAPPPAKAALERASELARKIRGNGSR